ncbi:MAG: hypothetical protein GY838_05940 [bacterium]|nr:hypothetical protein [bacterium]
MSEKPSVARYRKVEPLVFNRTRGASDLAFRAYMFLRVAPPMTQLLGLVTTGPGTVTDAIGAKYEAVQEALQELQDAGLIVWDRENQVIYLPGIISRYPPQNPNMVAGIAGELGTIPVCPASEAYLVELRDGMLRSEKEFRGVPVLLEELKTKAGDHLPTLAETVPEGSLQQSPEQDGCRTAGLEDCMDEGGVEDGDAPPPATFVEGDRPDALNANQRAMLEDMAGKRGVTVLGVAADLGIARIGWGQVSQLKAHLQAIPVSMPAAAASPAADAATLRTLNEDLDFEFNEDGAEAAAAWIERQNPDLQDYLRARLQALIADAGTTPADAEHAGAVAAANDRSNS